MATIIINAIASITMAHIVPNVLYSCNNKCAINMCISLCYCISPMLSVEGPWFTIVYW